MQVTEQEMREAIGSELADILHRQQAVVECNSALKFLEDENVKTEFKTMAEDDAKNLRLLETVIGAYGVRVEPKTGTVKLADAFVDVVTDSTTMPLEKLSAYTLLKQNQVMCSQLVHKSVQLAKPDIKAAVAPFEGVYASFSRQMSELTGYVERFGVEWITGREPEGGIIGRARDAVSSFAGAILSRTAKPADEMDILSLLTIDHRKVDVLFQEIEATQDSKQAQDLFQQLKADLTSHSLAEEERVYSRFNHVAEMKQLMGDAKQEHEEIRSLLDDVTDVTGEADQFAEKLDELKTLVKHHVDEEEDEVYELIRKNSTARERQALSHEFILAKKRIQENIGVEPIISSAANADEAMDNAQP